MIDPTTGTWDTTLVRDVFWEEDAQAILALTVHEGRENVLTWQHEENGIFSVKSAYIICREERLQNSERGRANGGSSHGMDPVWDKIWKLDCPNKVKHFVWRLAHNSHPLRRNLFRRGMKIDTKCPVRDRLDEDGGHLFLKCKFAKQVWRELKLEEECAQLSNFVNAREVVAQILKKKQDKKMIMIIAMWFLWNERNAIREEGRRRTTESIARAIRSYAEENWAKPDIQQQGAKRGVKYWSRPQAGILKLNCDAAFNPENKSGGWGFLIRDNDGDVVLNGWGRVNHLLNAAQAETIACLQGVQAAVGAGIGRLILETDSMMVVHAMERVTPDRSMAGEVIEELKFLESMAGELRYIIITLIQ